MFKDAVGYYLSYHSFISVASEKASVTKAKNSGYPKYEAALPAILLHSIKKLDE
jgi:hypothetical protein